MAGIPNPRISIQTQQTFCETGERDKDVGQTLYPATANNHLQVTPFPLPNATKPYVSVFTPELDLLLACCGDDCGDLTSAKIQHILQQPVALDWNRLLWLAEHHGMIPALYRRLSIEMSSSQSAQLDDLLQLEKRNAHRALWLTSELISIHKHLAARGLEAQPYKGPMLAENLYGNVGMRQFSDLDLLVHAHSLPALRTALAELGYEPAWRLTPPGERAYLKSGYEYPFDGPHGRNLVEIKWQILPRFYSIKFEVRDFFARAVTAELADQQLRTLCDQDLILVLCVHAAKHGWMQISWLQDIAQLARSPSLDWAVLRREAEQLGIVRIVAVSFLLAHELLGAVPPPELNPQDDPAAESIAQKILRQIVASADLDPESIAYFRLMMDLRERWRDRILFLWRLLVTPGAGEWSAIRLPGALFPLYRMVRMFRLARRMVSCLAKT